MTYGEALLTLLGLLGGPLMVGIYMLILALVLFGIAGSLEDDGEFGWSLIPGTAGCIVIVMVLTLLVWSLGNGIPPHSWEPALRMM